jgi:hypothetical protein
MKVSPIALAFTVLASRNASPIRAFSNAANVLLHSSTTTTTTAAAADVKKGRAHLASCPSTAAAAASAATTTTARAMSSTAEAAAATPPPTTSTNPLLECTDLPKFSIIEPSQLTPAMTSILEKLEADFAALEAKMGEGGKEIMSFEEVLPVVEKMQHSLGECSTLVLLFIPSSSEAEVMGDSLDSCAVCIFLEFQIV